MENLKEMLRAIPKAELHTHLDGCVRPATMIKLAKEKGIKLPTDDVQKLCDLLFKDRYESLDELLRPFGLFNKMMKTADSIEEIAYEFAWDYINDGVYYTEVRFAPQLHVGRQLEGMEKVLEAANAGMCRAAKEYNSTPEVLKKEKPEFKYGIICCIMRNICKGMSEYFDNMLDAFKCSGSIDARVHASKELVLACIHARDTLKIPIVAIDLAGGENGNPCEIFAEAFKLAREHLFNITVHAGEADGAESIYNAITTLGAQRIGHALHLFDTEMVRKQVNAQEYCDKLAEHMAKNNICIEVNITSNMQTCKELGSVADHPVGKMIKRGLTVSMACDNLTISKTCLSKEIELLVKNFALSMAELKKVVLNGFDKSFFPGTYAEKVEYMRSIKKYYETIEAKYAKKE